MTDHTPDITTKRCSKCGQYKPATTEYFTRNKGGLYGLRPECHDCRRGIKQTPEQKERGKARGIEWRKQHLDLVRRYSRQYSAKKPRTEAYYERKRLKAKGYKLCTTCRQAFPATRQYFTAHAKHEDKISSKCHDCNREHSIKYARLHPEKVSANNRRRQKLVTQFPHAFTDAARDRCFDYWQNTCAYCGNPPGLLPGMRIDTDHVIPLSNPDCPGTTATNIVTCCRSCNSSKGNRPVATWLTARYGKRRAAEILAKVAAYFEWVKSQE
jgi:5-methylcytosine-specific restriction endonuclease McrA